MKLNRKWIMVLALVMSMAMATTGTLAYLTDRDSEANVFTMGNVEIDLNEEFDPEDAELIPGVDIEKKPTITNTGKNDAWVWATIAIPSALDSDDASKNVVHFNYSEASVAKDLWNWQGDGDWMITKETIDNVEYNVYTVLYETALKPGETTKEPVMTKVYMDPHVDIDPKGDLYHVENGVAEKLDWNINTNGNPIIYVSAYAIQTEGFETALEGYEAYNAQWGDKGAEYGAADEKIDLPYGDDEEVVYPTPDGAYAVVDSAAMDEAIKAGETVLLLTGEGPYIIPDSAQGKTLTIAGNGQVIATQDDGSYEGCDYSLDGSTVTFVNITINTDSHTYTGYARCNATYNNCVINGTYTLYGSSEFTNCTFNVTGDVYNIWTWGAPTATFTNCTFNSDGKAVLLYGQENTKLTLNNCLFNDNGGLSDLKAAVEIGNDYGKSYELIVNKTKVNGYEINDKGINTGSTLWGNKNSMGTDKLNVVIDGVDVY